MTRPAALPAWVVAALLQGCSFSQPPAPIHETGDARRAPAATRYVVKAGDTLYKIAFEHGLDYRQVAAWNGIADPALIRAGRSLRLTPSAAARSTGGQPAIGAGSAKTGSPAPPAGSGDLADSDNAPSIWVWPARGDLLAAFDAAAGMKGMQIAGRRGAAVRAAASGRVIYVGAGLRGYGKLIIIKHNNMLLSAYGHNDRVLVAESQAVQAGQVIGEMGDSDADRIKLHFEIREYGRPVDPLNYLPAPPG